MGKVVVVWTITTEDSPRRLGKYMYLCETSDAFLAATKNERN